jgi:hypothetical protein
VDLPTYYPGVELREKGAVITVAAGTRIENLDFALRRPTARKVIGIVRDEMNRPVDNLGVLMLSAPGGPYVTTVKADGSFEFSNVRRGTYVLHFNSPSPRFVGVTVEDEDVRVDMVIPAK